MTSPLPTRRSHSWPRRGWSLAVLLLAVGCGASTVEGSDTLGALSEPQTASPVTTSATPDTEFVGRDLRKVDWSQQVMPGQACFADHRLALHAGYALTPNRKGNPEPAGSGEGPRYYRLEFAAEPKADAVAYGFLGDDAVMYAAVRLFCNNNGGTASGTVRTSYALFSGAHDRVNFITLLTTGGDDFHGVPLAHSPVISHGRVRFEEAIFDAKSYTCCPRMTATTTWTRTHGRWTRRTSPARPEH